MFIRNYVFILVISFVAGCTSVPRDGDFETVKRLVDERIPQQVYWYQGSEEDSRVEESLKKLVSEPLTSGSAVQIALLNNRKLQSEYESLGIAQADLVQAGLLSNPVLFGSIRFPKGGKGGNNVEFEVAKEFLDILLRPARKRLAATEFEKAKLRVANEVMKLAAEVQAAFYEMQARQQLADVQKVAAEAALTSYKLAQRFDEAGNLTPLQLARERSAAAEMTADLLRSDAGLQSARDRINSLLGLIGAEREWELGEKLAGLPESDTDAERAEELALEQRLDLAAADKQTMQLLQALELTRSYRYIGGAQFGVSTEREPDGGRVTGPNFTVELPVFDRRQAEIARLESLLQQSKSRAAALRTNIRNEVHAALNRIKAARKLAEYYRDELVPAREQVVRFTQQEQNYMLSDVFELLFARRQETQAYRGYIEALADYWTARTELARVLGVGLPETAGIASLDPGKPAESTGESASPGNSGTYSSHGDAMQH